MNSFTYSENGLKMTERFEGLELTAYKDVAGILTIGYGHTGIGITPGMVIDQQQAETLLASDIAAVALCVNRAVTVDLNQNQFDALTDFTFNVGRAAFLGSSLLRILNMGSYKDCAEQFERWVYANGEVEAGIVRRRQAEYDLFMEPV